MKARLTRVFRARSARDVGRRLETRGGENEAAQAGTAKDKNQHMKS